MEKGYISINMIASKLDRHNSIDWLEENIVPDTVIDDNWYDYLIDGYTLYHLMVATQLRSYSDIVGAFEGYYMTELIKHLREEME